MDNIFLIQYLQGEIEALKVLNATDESLLSCPLPNATVRHFINGAIEARTNIINRFADRIAQAEKELETIA